MMLGSMGDIAMQGSSNLWNARSWFLHAHFEANMRAPISQREVSPGL